MASLDLLLVSDIACPWCWIGKRRIEAAIDIARDKLKQSGADVTIGLRWHPFQLDPALPPEGRDRNAYRIAKFGSLERSRELETGVAEAGAADGIIFEFGRMTHAFNTLNAHRLSRFAAETGQQAQIVEALFVAYFQQARDIGDVATLADIAAEAGMDRATILARLQSDEAAQEVSAEAMGIARAGISGVPALIANRHFLFSGAHPTDAVADVLVRAAQHPEVIGATAAQ